MTPSPEALASAILAAWEVREELHADPSQTAYRLFHGYSEGCPGLTLDRYGDALIATHTPELEPSLDAALRALAPHFDPTLVVSKPRRGRGDCKLLRGEDALLEVLDNGLRFQIEPMARRNAGLYLDARPARRWILANSGDRRILNLFAYTGSLGIAAAAGGARWVTHVELQKRQLRRAKSNHQLNDLPVDDRNLVREDLYRYLRRAGRREMQVDGIVLDPPPSVPRQGANRPQGQDFEALVKLAAPLLTDGGWLLCFFHRRERSREDEEAAVQRASPHPLEVVWRGTSGVDFPEDDPQAKLRLTAFARRS